VMASACKINFFHHISRKSKKREHFRPFFYTPIIFIAKKFRKLHGGGKIAIECTICCNIKYSNTIFVLQKTIFVISFASILLFKEFIVKNIFYALSKKISNHYPQT